MAKIGTKHVIFCDSINSVFQLVHNPAENLVLNIFLFRHYHEITDLKGLQIRREFLENSEITCHTILNNICFYLILHSLDFVDSAILVRTMALSLRRNKKNITDLSQKIHFIWSPHQNHFFCITESC